MSCYNFPQDLDIKPSVSASSESTFVAVDQLDAIRKYGIAGRIWEASYLMKKYLENVPDVVYDPPSPFSTTSDILSHASHAGAAPPHTIIELGAGTGAISAVLSALSGPHDMVIATDLPGVCPLLEETLSSRCQSTYRCTLLVRPLPWGDADFATRLAVELMHNDAHSNRYLTHVICCDLVYFPMLHAPLLRCLLTVTSPPFADASHLPDVIIAYKIRSLAKETPFWAAFGLYFEFFPVLARQKRQIPMRTNAPESEGHGEGEEGDENIAWTRLGAGADDAMFVFTARRRPESLAWDIPETDADLLAGVSAWGTLDRKGSDTFETLLLMDLGGY
ncbi:hypothetical protein FISHEDRAFT_36414 [Fistulina hepatica ATCC 64428]|uniref:Uncharacterized protein n=1 Tax=Fistulina hepatica ATCC 64428 TaxID=1128425 RepID=A0A0D7AIV8_9AGAR|nr:hypothetical protein FISHEDRAFT_36414 [Fistulina hepatica ATCC 64428]